MNYIIEALGDCALLIRLGERIEAEINARTHAVAQTLCNANLRGVSDIAPAYASVCVRYDPRAWVDPNDLRVSFVRIAEQIRALVENVTVQEHASSALPIEIPVCYGGEFGPDIESVATHAQLSVTEVIARHTAGNYRVAMLGFAPGFAYLLGLDSQLHMPRRADPRPRVASGSVAIGGAQTGIYPSELPGGWNLIGRASLALFDPTRDAPALLIPGQCVRLRAIRADEFHHHPA